MRTLPTFLPADAARLPRWNPTATFLPSKILSTGNNLKKESPDSEETAGLFPATRWSLVLKTLVDDKREHAVAELCQLYWSPVYYVIRSRGNSVHDAEDLTQGFFSQVLKREQLQSAAQKPNAGRLRSYLLKSLQNFLINEHRRKVAIKRGQGAEHVNIDAATVERQFSRDTQFHPDLSPEEMFDRRWASNVIQHCFDGLEREYQQAGKLDTYEALRPTLGMGPDKVSFADIAGKLGLTEGATRVATFRFRKQFRTLVREEIKNTVDSKADFEDEWHHLRRLLQA